MKGFEPLTSLSQTTRRYRVSSLPTMKGLRVDLERLEGGPDIAKFVESLKRRGVNENIISEAIAEFGSR